ncbi:HAD-IC family P-type ATPase [Nonomuraea ferruginea]
MPEEGLRLLGLVAILDPPRRAAAGTMAACRRAGIRPILITGDHPGTACAIATELGIIGPGEPVADCRALATSDGHSGASVYARATPEQKLALIEDMRADGEVVAMTGDGVNDGPALRRADIGVAMGDAAPRSPARPRIWSWPTTTWTPWSPPSTRAAASTPTSAASWSTACPVAPPRSPSC